MRFLIEPPAPGATNMARDLQLLAEGVPTVRLYGWDPACVSLGYAQPESDIDGSVCRAEGLDVVRRPTGGGAILHDHDEVTYSVVLPKGLGPPDLFGSYKFVANGVVQTLALLGVPASFAEGHEGRDPLCYLREEGVSVAVAGRKISGGAQKRTKAALLQHGTILLSRRTDLWSRIFRTNAEKIRANVACLRDFDPSLRREDVLTAAKEGFRKALAQPVVGPGTASSVPSPSS